MKYDRYCTACDQLYEVTCKISEKDTKDHECPVCASIEGEWRISAPAFTMHGDTRFGNTDRKSGFSEVISKIQERNPRTPICER